MKGDLDIVCETAISSVALFPPSTDVVTPTTHRGSFSTCGERSMLDSSLMP